MDHEDDIRLVEACAAGDARAWNALIDRYQRLVFSIPRRYGLDIATSEDVFQDVFAALLEHLPRLRNRRGLAKWLITTAVRSSLRAARRVTSTTDDPTAVVHDPPPDDLVDGWERRDRLTTALRDLGGRCEQLLIALHSASGRPDYAGIAARFDMPVGSIGPTRARCLRKLLELLGETVVEDVDSGIRRDAGGS